LTTATEIGPEVRRLGYSISQLIAENQRLACTVSWGRSV